jgi:hypothetical protein
LRQLRSEAPDRVLAELDRRTFDAKRANYRSFADQATKDNCAFDMKKTIFYAVLWSPLVVFAAFVLYLIFITNLPQLLYLRSIRNVYFDCIDFVPTYYVYKMKPGVCKLTNFEYDVTLTHDVDGFRKGLPLSSSFDAVTIGDSHAHGFGVADDQTFSFLLGATYKYATRNLAIGSFATLRELEVLRSYGGDAKYVILQYCENDAGENSASLRLDEGQFRSEVESGWKRLIANYWQGKSQGIKKPIGDIVQLIGTGSYTSKATWRRNLASERNMEEEALLFGRILARYRFILDSKRLVVLESASWGANSPNFSAAFSAEMKKLGWLHFKVIDTAKILSFDHYYFLDDHLNPSGHRRLAAAIADTIGQWEQSNQ